MERARVQCDPNVRLLVSVKDTDRPSHCQGTVQESKLSKMPGCFAGILQYDEVMPELNNYRFICFTSSCFDCRQMDVKFQIQFFLTPAITNETCYLILEITWFGPR